MKYLPGPVERMCVTDEGEGHLRGRVLQKQNNSWDGETINKKARRAGEGEWHSGPFRSTIKLFKKNLVTKGYATKGSLTNVKIK